MNQINIEIAYALPDRYYLKSFKVDEGTMIQTAILQSGILQQFTSRGQQGPGQSRPGVQN